MASKDEKALRIVCAGCIAEAITDHTMSDKEVVDRIYKDDDDVQIAQPDDVCAVCDDKPKHERGE